MCCDARTSRAVERWLASLPNDLHDTVRDALQDAAAATQAWWNAAATGAQEPQAGVDDPGDEELVAQPGGGLVAGVGSEDGEHPAGVGGAPALHLQRKLTNIVDRRIASSLAHAVSQAGRWADVRRLREFQTQSAIMSGYGSTPSKLALCWAPWNT